jgi:hypothetical protein
MKRPLKIFTHALVLLAILTVAHSHATAQKSGGGGGGFDALVKHLKTRYQARKRGIPLFGLAKFAVRIVKPAGVKSINLSFFEDLKNTGELPDNELSGLMRNALSQEWQPLVSVRQRNGNQVYIYAAEDGKDVKLAVLAINQSEAVLARVKIDPDALRKFLDNPKIMGISLGDNGQQQALQSQPGDDEK